MSKSLKTYLVEDARLKLSDTVPFAVAGTPSQSNFQPYAATSVSETAISFNLQIPSENIVIDRSIKIQSDVTLKLMLDMPTPPAAGADPIACMEYALTDSLQAFPLNSLITTSSCTINNTTTSESNQDIMAILLAMGDRRELSKFDSTCPTLMDNSFGQFADGVASNANVMAGADAQAFDKSFQGRGSFPVVMSVLHNWIDAQGAAGTPDTSLYA